VGERRATTGYKPFEKGERKKVASLRQRPDTTGCEPFERGERQQNTSPSIEAWDNRSRALRERRETTGYESFDGKPSARGGCPPISHTSALISEGF